MNKRYELNKSCLYRIRNRKKLASVLHLPEDYFHHEHEYEYYCYSKPKLNGDGERLITIPSDKLKKIQKRICLLLERIDTPDWVMMGKKGISYIDNADYHEKSIYVTTMDISKFYDSVTRSRVYKMFADTFKMSHDIAWIMTDLVTHDGKLPTGSPSSQIIAYWAYSKMFENIYNVAVEECCLFTLYVDDMTFSSLQPIPKELRQEVAMILKKNDLRVKSGKNHYYQADKLNVITGVGMKNGEKVLLNRKRVNILTQYEKCKHTTDLKDIEKLKGIMCAARQIEPDIFPEVWNFVMHYEGELKGMSKHQIP